MTLALYLCWLCVGPTATVEGWACFFAYAGSELPGFTTEAGGSR